MKKKQLSYLLLWLLLAALVTTKTVKGEVQTATVSVNPSNLTVDSFPKTFSVNITIEGATDVFGWQIVLVFNASILRCIDAEVPSNNIFGPGAIAPSPIISNGKVVYGANAPPGAGTFNGSGLLCRLTFNATALGQTELAFDTDSTHTFYSYIYNDDMEDLPANFVPGTVVVINEFAALPLMLSIVFLTAAALFSKKSKSLLKTK